MAHFVRCDIEYTDRIMIREVKSGSHPLSDHRWRYVWAGVYGEYGAHRRQIGENDVFDEDLWHVTHIPSGFAVYSTLSKRGAIKFARKMPDGAGRLGVENLARVAARVAGRI